MLLVLIFACTVFHISSEVRIFQKDPLSSKGCFGLECLPEQFLNVSQIIEYYNYPCENHEVQTEDGYILSLQRIPHGRKMVARKNEVVVLQHGFIDSATTWVMNPPHQSLAYILADHGYDVWLFNSRGNGYSDGHVNYTIKNKEFWKFSFEEMARYDLVASINYVLNITSLPQVHYIGHSQGTMIGFIEFSRNLDLGKKVKRFYALAPVATIGSIKGVMKLLSHFTPEIELFFKIFGVKRFLPNNWVFKVLGDTICATQLLNKFCKLPIFLICGFDTSNLNNTRIPVYITHTPAGTSVKDALHFTQLIKSNKFRQYDYGSKNNMKRYKQSTPPDYDITGLKTPVALFSATNDWLADPTDINNYLLPHINNTVVYHKIIPAWNHLDFVWGEDANKLIYQEILKLMIE